ncbi:MAG: hypothetical protein G01um1014106_502 [Parcubacteria group bacterium Gr01-1014_106]|nr:MAG: hypothetical protein G01um1014106_502 [Parcubacteria group bacterium Gr01-1014_106]
MNHTHTARAALLTVGVGILAFILFDVFPTQELSLTPSARRQGVTLTTIHGMPFTRTDDSVRITEPLAHMRIPLHRSVLGKRLMVRADVRLESGDRLELGVKKGAFWLDYERRELLRDVRAPGERGAVIHREVIFDLANAFVNDDGTIELMFFTHGPDEDRLVLSIDTLDIRIEPGQWNVATLVQRARGGIRDLIRRPSV